MPSAAFAARTRRLGRPRRFAVWTIPSPYALVFTGVSGAARLVSTPSRLVAPGLARDCHVKGFPEFEQFCTSGFPGGTQFFLSPQRLPFRHARTGWLPGPKFITGQED